MHSRAMGMTGSDKKPQPMPLSGREFLSRTSVSFPDPNSLLLRTGSAGPLIGGCQVPTVHILITTLKVNGNERFKIRVKVTSSPGAQDRRKRSWGHLKCYWPESHYSVLDGLFQLSSFNVRSVRSKCSMPRISFVENIGRHRVLWLKATQ